METAEQRGRIQDGASHLAKVTIKGSISACWWLPPEIVGYAATPSAKTEYEGDAPMLYISAAPCGSRRLGGSSCR
jgi:hypothetical protein